jgi:hypothetical protein
MSNNLALAHVAAAQNQKEVTINDQAGQLDAGLTDWSTSRSVRRQRLWDRSRVFGNGGILDHRSHQERR